MKHRVAGIALCAGLLMMLVSLTGIVIGISQGQVPGGAMMLTIVVGAILTGWGVFHGADVEDDPDMRLDAALARIRSARRS